MTTMKTLVVREFGGPLLLEEKEIPEPGPDEAQIRVRACAIDQFDLTIRDGKFPTAQVPFVLGHEISGEVSTIGSEVDNVAVGDRVVSTLYITCGKCRYCRIGRETICADFKGYVGIHSPGGYAEYTSIPAHNLVQLPGHISFAEGSLIANAIGTPFHAFTKRAKVQSGERVLITGAAGGVGSHAIQLARFLGAHVIAVDIGAEKLKLARELGADIACDANKEDFSRVAQEWTQGEGVDVVLELVGTSTFERSFKSLARAGRMVIVGSHSGRELLVNPQQMIANEWEILGSRNVTKQELVEVVDLVASGSIKPIVMSTHALEEAEVLHQRLRAGEIYGRAVLIP